MDGDYNWADGKSVSVYVSTVVAVHTDQSDIVGYAFFTYLILRKSFTRLFVTAQLKPRRSNV